ARGGRVGGALLVLFACGQDAAQVVVSEILGAPELGGVFLGLPTGKPVLPASRLWHVSSFWGCMGRPRRCGRRVLARQHGLLQKAANCFGAGRQVDLASSEILDL